MSSISFQNALSIYPKTTQMRAARAEILANNLANSDTPHYKARDIDFNAMLKNEAKRSIGMEKTHKAHIEGDIKGDNTLLYRNPYQPAIDGNTVDTQMEQTFYTENALRYNVSFEFLNSGFKGLKGAIKGQ